ncbi:MAG: HU family DNA-binding protein [Bacteroidales bacterium]|nr:HU family DNA-binding protein [Bacteroidales bacterium]
MNNKLSLSDLTDHLAKTANISKKDAAIFLKNLFETIEENLSTDKIVKIKGLGTFKLVKVESRRIANVNTGELQEIASHYKTSFIPDEALANAVNEPFAHLETMILDEETIADQPIVPIEQSENRAKQEEHPIINSDIESAKESEDSIDHTKSQRRLRWVYYFIVLLLITSGTYFGCNFYYGNYATKQSSAPQPVVVKDSITQPKSDSLIIKSVTKAMESVDNNQIELNADDILAKVTMEPGARLTRISLKYYGEKAFWVYIYEANKSLIRNPNRVPTGIEIVIPKKEIYQIDSNNPESVTKAKALETKILSNLE